MNAKRAAEYLGLSVSMMYVLGQEGLGWQEVEGGAWQFDWQNLLAVKKLQKAFSSSIIAATRYYLLQENIYQLQSPDSAQLDDVELQSIQERIWELVRQLRHTSFAKRVQELCQQACSSRSQILQLAA